MEDSQSGISGYECIFRTRGNSEYYRNNDKGLWMRVDEDGARAFPLVLLGSVNIMDNLELSRAIAKGDHKEIKEVISWQTTQKEPYFEGFVPWLQKGYCPIGFIKEKWSDEYQVRASDKNALGFEKDFNPVLLFGNDIEEIYRTMDKLFEPLIGQDRILYQLLKPFSRKAST